jgi:hypothetical protein
MQNKIKIKIYFSDFFEVDKKVIEEYGAFNISLINDLPLFIDPFLLFSSKNAEYQKLHDEIIKYVLFLKSKSQLTLPDGLIKSWFYFSEIKENWLGYSLMGNNGRGLASKFAKSLKLNLTTILKSFGDENGLSSHIEKLTLVKNGVGKDQISDLTTNLICGYLAKFTEDFAKKNIDPSKLGYFNVPKTRFDYHTESWASDRFHLPKYGKQFVLLTPVDMLTKDDSWISHRDFVEDFSTILSSVSNDQLRGQIDNYFVNVLPLEPTKDQLLTAIEKVIAKHPEILDEYIKLKEQRINEASISSADKVKDAQSLYVAKLTELVNLVNDNTGFYSTIPNSYSEGMARVNFLKHVIEKQDGYKLFYLKGKPISREQDLQIMFKLTWFASSFDMNAEANNGRGPADFLVSYGSADKSVIEFKLASNSQLERNLLNQAEIYKDASKANHPPIKAILYFKDAEFAKVNRMLKKHDLQGCKDIVLIDAMPKESASKV